MLGTQIQIQRHGLISAPFLAVMTFRDAYTEFGIAKLSIFCLNFREFGGKLRSYKCRGPYSFSSLLCVTLVLELSTRSEVPEICLPVDIWLLQFS